jgi:hypothetical protein
LPGSGWAAGCWDFSVLTSNLMSTVPQPEATAVLVEAFWAKAVDARRKDEKKRLATVAFMVPPSNARD